MRPPAAPRRPASTGGRRATEGRADVVVRPEAAPTRDRGDDLVLEDDDLDWDGADASDDRAGSVVAIGGGGEPAAAPVRSLEGAYAARDRARRRVLKVRLGIGAAVLAAVALLGWAALLSPLLALDTAEVTVTGAGPYVDPAAVVAAAAAQEGTSLLRVDTAALRDQVEQMPGVVEVSIARDLPRGLTVTVTPREPVAVVALDAAQVQLVGSDGVVIAVVAPEAVPAGLPTLAVELGTEDAGDALTEVLSVLAVVPPELRAQIAEAGATGPRSVRLVLVDGAEVAWGSARESGLKAAVLSTLLQVGAAYYDVSEPTTPITR
ncbi:peptidase S9 [Serinibacter arcticus]|uniref:Peptidase S9 n=1 Tax=Serinibacter arcticus TaxID=1655435 RepID=A0A2U1ZSS1_9MICO|nr:FtsQ-type POTRA domain-containing protein [Serinibacter arcticus]PWD50026.1 peptidase S9 [Serinibacter arcticus]